MTRMLRSAAFDIESILARLPALRRSVGPAGTTLLWPSPRAQLHGPRGRARIPDPTCPYEPLWRFTGHPTYGRHIVPVINSFPSA
jgi:hypothetical protein